MIVIKTLNYHFSFYKKDWEAAIEELRDFKDDYPTRRNKEADLLENDDGSKGDCDSGKFIRCNLTVWTSSETP